MAVFDSISLLTIWLTSWEIISQHFVSSPNQCLKNPGWKHQNSPCRTYCAWNHMTYRWRGVVIVFSTFIRSTSCRLTTTQKQSWGASADVANPHFSNPHKHTHALPLLSPFTKRKISRLHKIYSKIISHSKLFYFTRFYVQDSYASMKCFRTNKSTRYTIFIL